MKLLAIGRPGAGADLREIGAYAEADMRALWGLHTTGTVREMYTRGRAGAVLMLEAPSAADAAAAVNGLPLATAGLIEFEVIEPHPFAALTMAFAAREGT